MIYRRKTYKVRPEKVDVFNDFFHEYLLPNQLKNGATLVGRWVNEARDELTAIWEYKSLEDYERIETAVRQDELHLRAKARRAELGELFLESKNEFLTPTGDYRVPKHIVSVSGLITNADGEVLLVKTHWRSDTWELPGGQMEAGETPEEALKREVREETGLEAEVGISTGTYFNQEKGLFNLVFLGRVIGGELQISTETQAVQFVRLTEQNADAYITRPHFLERALEALKKQHP